MHALQSSAESSWFYPAMLSISKPAISPMLVITVFAPAARNASTLAGRFA